jgi:hypothetical protein
MLQRPSIQRYPQILDQGEDERIRYRIVTTRWGSDPANIVVRVYDSAGVDVTATKMTGSHSVEGDMISLPLLHSIPVGKQYRVDVKFDAAGNTFEYYFLVRGK